MKKNKKIISFLLIWITAMSIGLALSIMFNIKSLVQYQSTMIWVLGFTSATLLSFFVMSICAVFSLLESKEEKPSDLHKKATGLVNATKESTKNKSDKNEECENQPTYNSDKENGKLTSSDALNELGDILNETNGKVNNLRERFRASKANPKCPECNGDTIKKGRDSEGNQRYRCKACGKLFK